MFVRNVDMKVHPDSGRALEKTFTEDYQPAISSRPDFDHVLLLHSAKNQNEYRLVIVFQDETAQKKWVATDLHQEVWPKMETNCSSYSVESFRTVYLRAYCSRPFLKVLLGEKVMSSISDSTRFRCISALICCAFLSFFFLIGASCSLAWGEGPQSPNTSTMNDASGPLAVAIGLAEAGKWEEAVSLLRPFEKGHPGKEEAWPGLGYSEFSLREFARATYALRRPTSRD